MRTSSLIIFVTGICLVKADVSGAVDIVKENENLVINNAVKFSYSSIFEMIREMIKQGYPDAGIPVLDPYQLDYTHIDFEGDIFRILANITDGSFVGLGDFQLRKLNFTAENTMTVIDFDVFFPTLNFTSEYYEMKGSIIEAFPLAGEGKVRVEIYDLNIWSKMYLKLNDDESTLSVDRFEDTGFTISRIFSKTDYDNNFDDIANAMVEDLLADYLNRFNKYLVATYNPLIIDALNVVLSGDSL